VIPKRILFCTDFSENSAPALECALEYARVFGAGLHLLHVINSSQIGYPSVEEGMPPDIRAALERIQQSANQALELVAQDCRGLLETVTSHLRVGAPAYEIVRYAMQERVNLIIMGTHGWTGFKHLILGSTAENVVRTASCPVLTVRGGRPDQPEKMERGNQLQARAAK
jgi:nucleotide-binding universal stress UspA family protein